MESDLDRYFKDQNAPVRSAVFDIIFDKAVKTSVEQTGMKTADILANEKLYNAALAQAQELTIAPSGDRTQRRTEMESGLSSPSR